jgi:hypothetical protein
MMKKRTHLVLIVVGTVLFLFYANTLNWDPMLAGDDTSSMQALTWNNSNALVWNMKKLVLAFSVYVSLVVVVIGHGLFWGKGQKGKEDS